MPGRLCLLVAAFLAPSLPVRAADKPPLYQQRWFYASTNLQVESQTDILIKLIERAGKAGYNGMVLADYKLNVLGRVPMHYFKNLERVKKSAAAAKIEIIPAVFPIGYSAGLLAHDPDLAEGLPVKNAPFVVKGRTANLVPAVRLRNGGLEEVRGDRFAGFSYQEVPGKQTFADRTAVHGGKVSCRMENFGKGGANCRLIQKVKVRPFACYRFSVWVKTKELKPAGNFRLAVLGEKGKPLSFEESEVKSTQDWARVEVVFNSLDQNEISFFAGIWGGKSGTLWLDDLKLAELSLVNVLRRSGCPLEVTSADGKTTFVEGKDFEPVRDEKLGRNPNLGDYEFRHTGPDLVLTSKSKIKDGDKLLVSWYHPFRTHSYQVMRRLTEPKVYELLRDQANRVHKALEPKTWFFSHDEIRVAGWCRSCRATHRTPGELLAANVKSCIDIVKKIDPKARIVIWSDMFDPNHNAQKSFYLVNGSLEESWQGLTNDVTIVNWNGSKPESSLKWFAGRGHKQILAGYYDSDVADFKRWHTAAKGIKGVSGFMYTTWRHNYDHLEAFGKLMLGQE